MTNNNGGDYKERERLLRKGEEDGLGARKTQRGAKSMNNCNPHLARSGENSLYTPVYVFRVLWRPEPDD